MLHNDLRQEFALVSSSPLPRWRASGWLEAGLWATCRRLAGALLLLATLDAAGAATAAALTIAVAKTPLSLPLYVAQSQGYFDAEGVQVKLVDVVGGKLAMDRLLLGEADLATSSETVVMFSSFQGREFALLASFVTSSEDVRLIGAKTVDPARPLQMRGKRIGMVPASASQYYLDSWLLLQGIDPNEVTRVSLAPDAMESALARGEVDAVVTWEPFAYRTLRAVPQAKAFPNMGSYTLSFNLLVGSRHLGRRDAELGKILRALERAEQFIRAQPQQAQALLRLRLELDPPFIDWIWPRTHYQLSLNQSLLYTLESEARWARQEGHVKAERSPNYLDFIYPGPLRSAVPGAAGFGN